MSGGAAVILVDACAQYGLEVAELSPETQARLQQLSPSWMRATNPLDYWPLNVHSGLGLAETTQVALRTFIADPNIDGIVLTLGIVYLPESLRVAQTASELMETFAKPICWWAGAASGEKSIAELEKAGVVTFPSCERAIRALGKLGDYWQFRQTL
jgi:acyl-CoA synthetase (NDP forming)